MGEKDEERPRIPGYSDNRDPTRETREGRLLEKDPNRRGRPKYMPRMVWTGHLVMLLSQGRWI